jgi:acyl-CoA thioester hydrolase
MNAGVHLYPLRVYYEETDAGRMVYHAAYLKFAERARTEMMRVNGLNHIEMIEKYGLVFAVRSADIQYLKQAKLEDELLVQTSVASLGGASMVMDQKISAISDAGLGASIAEVKIKLVIVNEAGRPQRLPDHIKTALERLRDEKG